MVYRVDNNLRSSRTIHQLNRECLRSTFIDELCLLPIQVQKDTYVFVIPKIVHGSYQVHEKVHYEHLWHIHDKFANVCKVFFAEYCTCL